MKRHGARISTDFHTTKKSTRLINCYEKSENKAILYFSASSVSDFQRLYDFGIRECLVSYYYIRKNFSYWDRMLPIFNKEGGIFMADSGAFSFMGKYDPDSPECAKFRTEEFWLPYLRDYLKWIEDHWNYIFAVANLDLDMLVGEEIVDKWNRQYFEPFEEKGMQVIYVSHPTDKRSSFDRLRQYCKKYKYVGVNQSDKNNASKIYQLVKHHGNRVHGFAWTEFSLLKRFPFFSVDSVTWLGGARFGTTYDYDGKNFTTIDYKHKYRRKSKRLKYEDNGIRLSDVVGNEVRSEIHKMNLLGWMGFRKEFLKIANMRLWNKEVCHYERKC